MVNMGQISSGMCKIIDFFFKFNYKNLLLITFNMLLSTRIPFFYSKNTQVLYYFRVILRLFTGPSKYVSLPHIYLLVMAGICVILVSCDLQQITSSASNAKSSNLMALLPSFTLDEI